MTSKSKHASSRTVYVIGENFYGQLALGSIGEMQSILRTLPKDITTIYTGKDYSIFRDIHNNYYSAGYNQEGSCATSNTQSLNNANIPLSTVNTSQLKIHKVCVNVSSRSTFWITTDNKIYANGSNSKQQLGLPAEHVKVYEPTLLPFFNDVPVFDIQPAAYYTIILGIPNQITIIIIKYWTQHMSFPREIILKILKFLQINKMYAAGESKHFGYGQTVAPVTQKQYWNEIVTFKDRNIVKVRCGYDHSLFLQNDGTLWSCGRNDCFQRGIGSTIQRDTKDLMQPIRVEFGNVNIKIMDITCGSHHSLAIDMNGNAYSWGLNGNAQCGCGNSKDVFKPVLISGLFNCKVVEIDCGCVHSYCKTMDGKHWLFGSNSYNECVTFDVRKIVMLPFCVNDIVREKTGGEIGSISLGQYSTVIVVYEN